jgi:hypothetical protein
VVWFDEEPPMDIYMEGLTRTNATGGMVYLTFTPLARYVRRGSYVHHGLRARMTRSITRMTIEDAGHYTKEQRDAIIASYPEHEREARVKGACRRLGSGRVFPDQG